MDRVISLCITGRQNSVSVHQPSLSGLKIFKQEYNVIIFFPFYLCFTTRISFYSVVYPYGWQFQKLFWVANFHFRWQISHFSLTLGGSLPPKIMPENKNAAMILVNHYCKKWLFPPGIEPRTSA